MSSRLPNYILIAAALMIGSVAASKALTPTIRISDIKPKIVLEELFPAKFGQWEEVPHVRQVVADPTVKAMIDATYSQTLARAYVNARGDMVMLMVAYGSDQTSEATAAHRPEFCYAGQGFTVVDKGTSTTNVGGTQLTRRLLVGTRETYSEQISYWVTLDNTTTLPGLGRKIAQMRYGLRGYIADGMLVRLSTPMASTQSAQKLQDEFLRDMVKTVPASFRPRVFGT